MTKVRSANTATNIRMGLPAAQLDRHQKGGGCLEAQSCHDAVGHDEAGRNDAVSGTEPDGEMQKAARATEDDQ